MSTMAISSRNPIIEQLSAALRKRMRELGMTQTELSENTGIPRAELCRFLNGHSNPSVSRVFEIAEAIGMKIEIH